VGTVFIAVADERRTLVKRLRLKGSRREIKEEAAEQCLRLLHREMDRFSIDSSNPPLLKGDREGSPWFTGNASAVRQRIEHLRHSKESEIVIIHKAPKGISWRKGRLGIFPASFNPPTLAHLALIKEAKKQGNLDEILILLDIQAMDKDPVGAALEDRLAMLRKAFGRDPKVSIGLSNRGLFLEKIKPLRTYYPAPISFSFIVGFDTILRVMDKKYYPNRKRSLDELLSQSRFLAANRGDQEREAFEELFGKPGNRRYKDKVSFFTLHPQISSLSSTLVRVRIARGQSVDDRVPAAILPFIKEKGLYQTRSRNR
jgi:nicotinamide-nucleotide adenylyltransferase